MDSSILWSTFVLTSLMLVGLFFFIRASVKARIQVAALQVEQPPAALLAQVQEYFAQRAYRVVATEPEQNKITFEGVVSPSWFLAILLSGLAAVGALCLMLILSILMPQYSQILPGFVLVAPLAGLFYWRGAKRLEKVVLQLKAIAPDQAQSLLMVTGHRDELAEFQRALKLAPAELDT